MSIIVLMLTILSVFSIPAASGAFCFKEAGERYSINPVLLESIARAESDLDPKATNKNRNGSVDMGLMQVNSAWVRQLSLDSAKLINDPCYNTMAGARILKKCIDSHGYTWEAVGCYNAVSMDKKKAYSWRVFRQIKSKPVNDVIQAPGNRSLSFKAWDIIDASFGRDSNSAAGRIQ